MVEPLFKRAQLPSSLILTWLCFQAHSNEWAGLGSGRELSEMFYAQGVLSRVTSCVTPTFWGDWPPFFAVPSFKFKHTFLVVLSIFFGKSFTKWSGLLCPKQLHFLFCYKSTTLANSMTKPSEGSTLPTLPLIPKSSSVEDSASFSPLGFGPESSSVLWSSITADWAVKVWLPFNFLDGNRFPCEWEWVTFKLPVLGVFGSRGSLASTHLSSF